MKPVWLIGISPGNPFYFNYENILKLINKAPLNYRIVIFSPLEIYKVSLECSGLTHRNIMKKYRDNYNKIAISINNLKSLNKDYEFVEWNQLVNTSNFEIDKIKIINDEELFTKIYNTTNDVISKLRFAYNKDAPDHKTIMQGTTYLVNELAMLLNIRESLQTNKCIIPYSNTFELFDIFVNKYDWIDMYYL